MKKHLLFIIIAFTFGIKLNAQSYDTISIMYYNLLNFPDINPSRISYLETTLHYVMPDIFVIEELTSGTGASSILNNALNTQGVTNYAAATWVNGTDTENMLYYNTDKIGFVSQYEIQTSLRDINEYILYYKAPNIATLTDTTFFYVYAAHLKAGSTASDETQRASETTVLKSYLVTRPYAENTIVGGDMNIYTSSETAYNNLTASNLANLYDPLGAGNYHNNSSYTTQFTQSTRTTSFDTGATGGMDDRFDYILFSDDMIDGSKGARFIASSYKPIGQDGNHWNQPLNSPTNNAAPSNVINALYLMSDHLPIYMKIEVGGNLGITGLEAEEFVHVYPIPATTELSVNLSKGEMKGLQIMDMQGRIVLKDDAAYGQHYQTNVEGLVSGVYFLWVNTDLGRIKRKIVIEWFLGFYV